jgi:maltose O-acetyltransferase
VPAYLAASWLLPLWARRRLLQARGHQFGSWSRIRARTLVLGSQLVLGRDVFINEDCVLEAIEMIQIGDETHLARGVRIFTLTHHIGGQGRRAGDQYARPVRIADGVWVGAGATILPGITVNAGAVIAAGSVVTKDVAANTLVGGTPAREIRALSVDEGTWPTW